MPEQKRPLKVFLCHAHIDKDAAKQLYDRLVVDGVDAWLDKEKLLGGANWEYEIRKAVRECDIFLVCVSEQFTQRLRRKNFAQTEVGIALNEAELKPKEQIYIVPVRLENCAVPKSLQRWHWVDLFEPDGYERLIRSLNKRIEELKESDDKSGHNNISVVISGQVGGNVIVGNDNSVQQTPAQQPIEAEKQEPRMFYDLPRHFEHVVPNANAETIAKVILEAVTRIMWFTEIPDENNEDRNIQYATEKGEYYDPKNNNTLQYALIIHGQKSILVGKKKNGTDGFRVVQQIEALPEMLIVTVTQRIDGAILTLDSEKIPDKIFQRFVKMALQEIGIPSASNGLSLADETKKTKVTTPNEGNKKKLNPAYVVAIIGLIGTILAALIGILPQIIKPVPAPTATISPTTALVQISTSTLITPEPSLTPADTLTPTPWLTEIIDDQGISMRFVPAGEFIMGSDNGQNDEKPPHSVVLGGYYMDVYEVTNGLYKNCVDADVCTSPSNTKSKTRDFYYGDPAYDDYPVIYVDWNQAKTYCAWRGARLPSEAEWEKAARGADGWAYPWGDVFDGTRINFCDKNCSLDWAETFYDDGYADTAPIGSYEMGKSIYDLYDMSGNAAEWTADMYSAYPGGTLDVNDSTAQSYRVFRGGAWYYIVDNLRISNRGWSTPDSIDSGIGFRCARDAQP